jgi:hypothetical protein
VKKSTRGRNLRENLCPKISRALATKSAAAMLCPFCKKTIHIEFSANAREWIAMRDDSEHMCAGLAKAMNGAQRAANTVVELPNQQPLPNRQLPASVSPVVSKKTRGGLRRLPIQLELQAID